MHPWQLGLIWFWKCIFPVMWQDVGEWGEQKWDKNWMLQETWMCYDKPGAIICLLCKAALAQRKGREGMQCYEVPPVHGWALLAESCFCCSHVPSSSSANTKVSDCSSVSTQVSYEIVPSLPFATMGTVSLCQLKNESPSKFINFEVGDQLSTHFLWPHAIQEVLKKFPHLVFEIRGSIPCRKACLSAWESNIRVYELISTPDQTKDLVSLKDVSAETYGIFLFAFT